MERDELIKQVSESFKANPNVEKFHVTKDAQCFIRENDAKSHERFLGVHHRGVEVITRESVERHLSGKPAKEAREEKAKAKAEGTGTGPEQGGTGKAEAAASEQGAGATATDKGTDGVDAAKEALEADRVAKAATKTAAKKAAPKKAAAKKTTKKKK